MLFTMLAIAAALHGSVACCHIPQVSSHHGECRVQCGVLCRVQETGTVSAVLRQDVYVNSLLARCGPRGPRSGECPEEQRTADRLARAGTCLQVIAQLLGAKPMPWEPLRDDDRRRMGPFREPVLQLLQRDAARRASMLDFYRSCTAAFAEGRNTAAAGGGDP